MYYKDQARQFSLLSGLTLGIALGAALTLLLGVRWRARARRSVRDAVAR